MTSFTYLYSFITMPKVHGYLAPEAIMVYCVFLCRVHALIKSLCSHLIMTYPLRKKCPHSELFCSVFSRIRTEYGEIRSISPYSVRMRENTDQNNFEYGHFLRSE